MTHLKAKQENPATRRAEEPKHLPIKINEIQLPTKLNHQQKSRFQGKK